MLWALPQGWISSKEGAPFSHSSIQIVCLYFVSPEGNFSKNVFPGSSSILLLAQGSIFTWPWVQRLCRSHDSSFCSHFSFCLEWPRPITCLAKVFLSFKRKARITCSMGVSDPMPFSMSVEVHATSPKRGCFTQCKVPLSVDLIWNGSLSYPAQSSELQWSLPPSCHVGVSEEGCTQQTESGKGTLFF